MFDDQEDDAMSAEPSEKHDDSGVVADRHDAPVTGDAVPAAAPRTVHDVIDEWFVKHFHGLGPHLTEFMHAKLHAAKEDLKTLIWPAAHS